MFIPILLTNLFFYQVITKRVYEQKMEDVTLTFKQIQSDFSQVVDEAVGSTTVLYTDVRLYDYLDREYARLADYIAVYDQYLRGLLNKYGPIYHSVYAITLYSDNPTLSYSGGVNNLTDEVKQSDWYQELNRSRYSIPLFIRTPYDGGDTFSVIRLLNYYKAYDKWEKILKIDLNMDTIRHIFSNVTFPGYIYLLDDSGRIQYSTDPGVDWHSGEIIFSSRQLSPDMIVLTESLNNRNYFQNWKIVGVIQEAVLLDEVRKSGRFIFYMAAANLLIPTFIIVLISRSLHARLALIVQYIRKVKNQQFDTIDRHEEYRDEIGEITREFNRMTRQINKLINEVYVASIQKKDLELKKKQAQLNALQSQINPHFIFNALETIRMRSMIKDEAETAEMIANLARILKKSFIWGRDWVTLQEEMDLILSFLEIQQYRFEQQLNYEVDVHPSAYPCLIPNMILLPFVENACLHGIKPSKQGGTIWIKVQVVSGWLQVGIEDNGVGIAPDKLNQIKQSLMADEEMGESVGIKNVFMRLNMHYGQQFNLDIHSQVGQGTAVHLSIPARG
ncbi:two-component system sensor histidine kinase YesM [Caldalkalibacillus uzonensis]|uniref:Two-component system sensor histidine kinase YesM n=1 Tax=Caldalkalibacillus uzonensis TaxID=353224 RepID=A0ABU0CQE2_9BACI|nr:two-component system sensor histidine kinase YesM [Caldalkalibacillus uzonensis]